MLPSITVGWYALASDGIYFALVAICLANVCRTSIPTLDNEELQTQVHCDTPVCTKCAHVCHASAARSFPPRKHSLRSSDPGGKYARVCRLLYFAHEQFLKLAITAPSTCRRSIKCSKPGEMMKTVSHIHIGIPIPYTT